MNTYALYSPETGKVSAFIQCAPRNAELQVRNGLVVMLLPDGIPGLPDDFMVENGVLVSVP